MNRSYAVVRPVANTYLIRERDRRRRRDLLWVAGTLLPVAVGALLYVWLHVEVLRAGYRIHELEQELRVQVEIERQLGLEVAFLQHPGTVEQRATTELGLAAPTVEQLVYIEAAR